MEKLYIDGKPIIYDGKSIYSGEEANIHRYRENELIKIFKEKRRLNIPPIQPSMYQYLSEITTNYFYLPIQLAYNEIGNFRAYTMSEFKNPQLSTHAQKGSLEKLMKSIEGIEEDTEILSEAGVKIVDLKIDNIVYNSATDTLGIVDCGIYQKDTRRDLWIQNLKEVNYYLRQALLWANYEGTKLEMVGIDFPEIYDELDNGTMRFSEVLKEEISKYKVKTLEELKHCYQKEIFY